MIIKPSRPGQGGPALARYLMEGKNEHAELLELRNMDAPSLQAALFDMDMLAAESRQCRNHALHIQMRAAPGERLSASHWQEAADRVTALFGMEAHQAALVLHHQQDGCTHAHLVLNRVHPETLIAADVWRSQKKCIDLSRTLEQEWGLRQLDSQNKHPQRDYSKAGQQETEQARRQGANVHDIREHVRWLWEQSPNGPAFAAALEEEGYQLAKGDRRAYVVLDPNGGAYSLGQRTTGAKAREVREKLGDLDPASVPDITEGRRLLTERQAEQKQQQRQGKGEARAQSQPTPEPTPEPTPQPKPANAPEPSPAVSWWTAASQRAALNPPAPRFYASPRTYPPQGFKAWLSGLFRAKAAKPAPTPQPARPLADAEPPAPKTPEESLLESLRKQEEERQEAKRQHKGRGRSPMGDLLDAHFRKGNTPR